MKPDPPAPGLQTTYLLIGFQTLLEETAHGPRLGDLHVAIVAILTIRHATLVSSHLHKARIAMAALARRLPRRRNLREDHIDFAVGIPLCRGIQRIAGTP